LMTLFCPATPGQTDGQEQQAAEAKLLQVSITLKSGEVITGLLVKIDNNSVDFKVKDILQSVPTSQVLQISFGAPSSTTAKNDSTDPVFDSQAPVTSKKPVILYKEKASYTDQARRNLVQGEVILNLTFNANGTISDIHVLRGLPDGLTEQAIKAAKKI